MRTTMFIIFQFVNFSFNLPAVATVQMLSAEPIREHHCYVTDGLIHQFWWSGCRPRERTIAHNHCGLIASTRGDHQPEDSFYSNPRRKHGGGFLSGTRSVLFLYIFAFFDSEGSGREANWLAKGHLNSTRQFLCDYIYVETHMCAMKYSAFNTVSPVYLRVCA